MSTTAPLRDLVSESTFSAGIQNARYWRAAISKSFDADSEATETLNSSSAKGQTSSAVGSETWSPRSAAIRVDVLDRLLEQGRAEVPSSIRVSGMQKWEGRVLGCNDDYFTAELVPAESDQPTVIADFEQSQLGADRGVSPGDVVYITVRTVMGANGYPHRTSAMRLRRLGRWTAAEIERQESRAALARQEIVGLLD